MGNSRGEVNIVGCDSVDQWENVSYDRVSNLEPLPR